MRTKIVLTTIIAAVAIVSFFARSSLDRSDPVDVPSRGEYRRIVSLSPSVTEILFSLGAGDRIAGVTRYCLYPPEANDKPKVGGFLDPNFEAIVALEPDLVIMRGEPGEPLPAFEELRLPTLVVSQKSIENIYESINTIGGYCGAEEEAARIVADVESRLKLIEEKTAGLDRPTVMFAVDRTLGIGRIEDVYIAGADGFIDRVVELAGGQNACPAGVVRFPVVSSEGIIKINPEVIVDLVALRVQKEQDLTPDVIAADWQQLDEVAAVSRGKVYLVDDDFAFIPGPRFHLLAERLARLIHPELDWEDND